MKFVLDASVALKTVLKEPDSAVAIALRDDFKNQIHQLIAPDTLPIEIAHALTRAQVRRCFNPKRNARRTRFHTPAGTGETLAEIG
jgi:predicted nucleic acid-binding protein